MRGIKGRIRMKKKRPKRNIKMPLKLLKMHMREIKGNIRMKKKRPKRKIRMR
jgi:hypothetical protein